MSQRSQFGSVDAYLREGAILHRSAITAMDKIPSITSRTLTGASQAGATLVSNTTYYVTIAPANRFGPTIPPTVTSGSPGGLGLAGSQSMKVACAAVTGAEYFDIFCSAAGSAAYLGRVAAADMATGVRIVSAGSPVTTSGSPNAVVIGVVGTGITHYATPFTINNAYTPASVTPIDCTGFKTAHVHAKLSVTDLTIAPALSLIPFVNNGLSTSDWHAGTLQTLAPLSALGKPMEMFFDVDIYGAASLVILVDTITGQGASANVWVDLS